MGHSSYSHYILRQHGRSVTFVLHYCFVFLSMYWLDFNMTEHYRRENIAHQQVYQTGQRVIPSHFRFSPQGKLCDESYPSAFLIKVKKNSFTVNGTFFLTKLITEPSAWHTDIKHLCPGGTRRACDPTRSEGAEDIYIVYHNMSSRY